MGIKIGCQTKMANIIRRITGLLHDSQDEIIDQIFTPFFTTRKGGSGIGLSLARQVMQMHNGSIRVNSVEGEQTTFTLTI